MVFFDVLKISKTKLDETFLKVTLHRLGLIEAKMEVVLYHIF